MNFSKIARLNIDGHELVKLTCLDNGKVVWKKSYDTMLLTYNVNTTTMGIASATKSTQAENIMVDFGGQGT